MKKRIFSLLLAFCMLLTLLPTAAFAANVSGDSAAEPEEIFTDVKKSNWFYDAVRYVSANGIFNGTGAQSFSPYGTMTRAMFVTVLGRMAGIDPADYSGSTGFADVPEGSWYAPYVKWAVQFGITLGVGDGKFAPEAEIDRSQMAVFFVRYFEAFGVSYETGEEITTEPADLDSVPAYAKDAVMKLWRQGLLNGDGVNFAPADKANRAQVATLSQRVDKAVDTWYSEPGVPSERERVDPDAQQGKEEKKHASGTNRTTYYEVQFALGEGQQDIELPATRSVARGTAINTLPTPSKAGAIFLGWYYDQAMTQPVEIGDTVDRSMTLYARAAQGDDVQPIETPNYITRTDVPAGTFSFRITGVGEEAFTPGENDLKLTGITGGNIDVAFTLNNDTVSATLEAGQTYQVELLNDNAQLVVDGKEQGASVRYLNILTAKEETTIASLNGDIVQLSVDDTTGLDRTVFNGLYTVDETNSAAENTSVGSFTYSGSKTLKVGDTVAVISGNADLTDVTSTEGDVAYLKITSVNGATIGYEMAELEDVLFMPDVLPIESGWDTDSVDNQITISADALAIAMDDADAKSLDVGDFVGFYTDKDDTPGYTDETVTAYGEITEFEFFESGNYYVIAYTAATADDIGSSLDVYYSREREVELTEEERQQIEDEIKKDVQDSGYPEQAAAYLAAVMLESNDLTTVPSLTAVEERLDELEPYILARSSSVQLDGGQDKKVSVEFDAKNINVKLGTNATLEHLQGKGFNVEINIPFTVTIGENLEIAVTATFEEEVILRQTISTKKHHDGFFDYDYSLNASFEIGNYTGIGFTANVSTTEEADEADKSMIETLENIMDRMKDYQEAGGVSGTDGTVESLADIYADVMENANDTWIEIVNVKLFESDGSAFLHIFCWQIKGSFVVSANLAATIGMSFDYTTQKQYNFSVRVKAKTSTNETIDIIAPQYNFDFYVVGTLGIKAGLRLEMYVGLFSLSVDKIGISADVGAYAQLWGYFFYHLKWTEDAGTESNSAGALFIEIGLYVDIKFLAQALNSSKLTWNPTIYEREWPLWSAGKQLNIYAFVHTDDTEYTMVSSRTFTLPWTTYNMYYINLKTGAKGITWSDAGSWRKPKGSYDEMNFYISFSNSAFSYDPVWNLVTVTPPATSVAEETDMIITYKHAPLAFSSAPIQKIIHISWTDPENTRFISFDSQGGSVIDSITGGSGASITWPTKTPERQGYIFDCWCTDSDCTTPYTGSTTIMPTFPEGTKGMTLYAKWTPRDDTLYTVEHYLERLNGTYGLVLSDSTQTGETGLPTKARTKSYDGYTVQPITQESIAADGSTVVKIYYDRNRYTVTFDAGYEGGDTITGTYKHGETLAVPSFVREGYTFADWDGAFAEEDGFPVAAANVTYTAQWQGKPITVTFVSNGGSTVNPMTVNNGSTFTAPTTPTRTGYDFAGWYTDRACTDVWSFATDTVAGSMTLYAKWTAKQYTVTFDVNGGSSLTESTKSVTYADTYGTLPTPPYTGYGFDGWFTAKNGGSKITAGDTVTVADDHTLYAHWTEGTVSYTVKHFQQNVENDEYTLYDTDSTMTGKTGATTVAEAKAYAGFTAKGFEQKTIAADGSTVVEIYYDRNTYSISWDVNGGDELTGTDYTNGDVKFGTAIDEPEPTRTGYELKSWSPEVPATVPAENVTFTAQWEKATYRITYELDGGTNAYTTNPPTYTYGTGAALAAPSKTGHTFVGWYIGENKVENISAADTGNLTLTAKWKANIYDITYELDGGTNDPANPDTYTYGIAVTLKEPTRDDYTFSGWYIGENKVTGISETQTDDLTITAKWTPINYAIYDDVKLAGEPIKVDGQGNVRGYPGVTYDRATHTLTLNNVTITADETTENTIYLTAYTAEDGKEVMPKINVLGTNTVKHTGSGWLGTVFGIRSQAGNITFTGSGTLNVLVEDALGYAIYAPNGTMTVEGPAINATANYYNEWGTLEGGCGVVISKTYSVNVYSGSLTAQGGSKAISSSGIRDKNGAIGVYAGTSAESATQVSSGSTRDVVDNTYFKYITTVIPQETT